MGKTVKEWLKEYGESHRNPINIKIHKFCVPIITFSLLGLFSEIPVPEQLAHWKILNWASVFIVFCVLFYLRLSVTFAVAMVVQSLIMMAGVWILLSTPSIPQLSVYITLFVIAWIFQFIGHKIEGKKPSFFKDLQFLLIGPLWTLSFLFRKLKINY